MKCEVWGLGWWAAVRAQKVVALPSGAVQRRPRPSLPACLERYPRRCWAGAGLCVAPSLSAHPERQQLLRLRFLVGSQLAQTCSKVGGTAVERKVHTG